MDRLKSVLLETLDLKLLDRTGWVRNDVANPESVASHSWGVAWLVTALCPSVINRERALIMAIIHDIGEVRIGDITPDDGMSKKTKHHLESQAINDIFNGLNSSSELIELWNEYELGNSQEANFVKACDKLDMALQAQKYMLEDPDLDLIQFINSAINSLSDESLIELAKPD